MKRILAIIVASSMMIFNTISVFAASNLELELDNTSYKATTNLKADFSAEMLGRDVIVNVPAQIILDYSCMLEDTYFVSTGTVTMRGDTGETNNLPNYIRITIEPRTILTNTENSNIKIETINVFSNLDCGALNGLSKYSVCTSMPQPILFNDSSVLVPYEENENCVQLRREPTLATAWATINFKIRTIEIPVVGRYVGTTHYYVNKGSASNIGHVLFAKN